MPDQEKNALERKVEDLTERWEQFAEDTDKPLLRWLVDPSGLEIIDLFFQIQPEEISEIPDLFLTFDVPFGDAVRYPQDLIVDLKRQHDQMKTDLAGSDVACDWVCPNISDDETSTVAFVRCLASFQAHYQDLIRNLAVVLRPKAIDRIPEWLSWLRLLIYSNVPPKVRFVVLEYKNQPIGGYLGNQESNRIHTDLLEDLDLPGMMEELAQGQEPGPSADFRVLFVKLANQAAKGDISAAALSADQALAIAKAQNWLPMQVVIHTALGAAYLQAKDTSNALAAYQKGTAAAMQAEQQNDPTGPKLVTQCKFGEAAVLITEAKYPQAAEVYETVPPFTQQQDDHILTMEAWRMAAYCHEMDERFGDAVRCGDLALQAGERLPEKERRQSTLPYVGQGLIRVLQKEEKKERRQIFAIPSKGQRTYSTEREVRNKMEALCGPDWEKGLAPSTEKNGPEKP